MKNSEPSRQHLLFEIEALKEQIAEQALEIGVLKRSLRDLRMLVYKATGDTIDKNSKGMEIAS